ncbi:hypothetical protein S83_067450 [Arachis hypogaea]
MTRCLLYFKIAVFEQTGIEKNASHSVIRLYQTTTFKQPNAIENGPYDYTRSGNSTRDALESLLAKLDKADRALCFTSGMAALSAVSHLVQADEKIIVGDDLYGGTDRLLSQVIPKNGIVVKLV